MANIGNWDNVLKGATSGNQLWTQGAGSLANLAPDASALTNVASSAGNVAQGAGKFTKMLDGANKIAAPLQAATGVVGLAMDITNSVEAQKQAKEQMDLAKKNFNLELEKAQKQELAYNELAGSIDRAWGGSGKVANTIDYSQYKTDSGGGSSLQSGGAGGHTMGPTDTPSVASASDMGGSGNTPMGTQNTFSPVGHSDSISDDTQESEEEQ